MNPNDKSNNMEQYFKFDAHKDSMGPSVSQSKEILSTRRDFNYQQTFAAQTPWTYQ